MTIKKKHHPAKKVVRQRRRHPWRRTLEERCQEDVGYLRSIVPVMVELGVMSFADVSLVGRAVATKAGYRRRA